MIVDNTKFEQEKFIESYKQFIQQFEISPGYQSTVLNILLIAHRMNNLNDININIPINYIEALIEALNETI